MSSESTPAISSIVSSGICTVSLDAPERKNALAPALVAELWHCLDNAMSDNTVRVIVLTNTGNTFCAGADLTSSSPGVAPTDTGPSFVDVFKIIFDGPKPVVGRIDGHATGGGVGLVAACDISVMRDDAKIGFTEVRIGVAPAIISVACLPKMSRAHASELFLTGERFTPQRAAEVGLINTAVSADQLDDEVDRYISMLVRGGPDALASSKELVRRVPSMERDAAFEWTAKKSAALFLTDEAKAGIAAFRNRQDAPWVPNDWK